MKNIENDPEELRKLEEIIAGIEDVGPHNRGLPLTSLSYSSLFQSEDKTPSNEPSVKPELNL